ncbi:MAG: hypothetical protein A2741_02555 [Candidatus Zambryskibacteria bacterium RIFCSPHIGHO2_01_FULL_43_27]|uniref:Metallo-beta-lactamase domain-containing protein n=1 Tax=Candidatus Zambryskibacteria bacterium RIFCSPLOWO2_01_FULL_43_17 TaxID=1802760 RepID=A0A1G2U5L5_9BACT|nr:MAG: hypothetical protein A2741_02555 [Candidatus Zambryskibacteria bacterium RIFCSPHIGHO2_01_FULL_43_27]OHA99992.1 MAG: hypothetical protein A3E93_00465 [Candidatus Zambryskibacteria bacterium RIFCSPHIGHO2_12_FULL_43_12b]OHB04240.1 MAG: hypothetical protein A2920_00825 [Candidatus Zambryskibacteria bacterium RIFCSPLOWO2_01_FULL_43_17]
MSKYLKEWKKWLLGALTLLNVIIWLSVWQLKPKDYVQISFLDIGQGDAIYIESRNGNQVLIDGGPDKKVLEELSKTMPFLDRSIDLVIESHPDKDHIGGLPDVVERYRVGAFLEPGVESANSVDDELKLRLKGKKVNGYLARRGMIVDMGDGSYLEILFPDRDVSGLETNDASIVAKYVFDSTCILLTGDSPTKIEDYLVKHYGSGMKCDVLKAGHHGSKTSTGDNFINAVAPELAIISAGKDNSYGHPHAEVIERLQKAGMKILSTVEEGTIKITSDGEKMTVK